MIRYKDFKISASLSVPKIADIWDMGLILKVSLVARRIREEGGMYHGCQGSI
jgi:hypothetical protein